MGVLRFDSCRFGYNYVSRRCLFWDLCVLFSLLGVLGGGVLVGFWVVFFDFFYFLTRYSCLFVFFLGKEWRLDDWGVSIIIVSCVF